MPGNAQRKGISPEESAGDAMRRAQDFLSQVGGKGQPPAQQGAENPPETAPPSKGPRSDSVDPIDRRQLSFPEVADPTVPIAPIEKTIWGSPAGKKRLAARLVKLIPPHKVYVEPFVGSGAVFFEKSPAKKQVLSDADPEIASAFRALATLTDGELEALKKKDWTGRAHIFRGLKDASPRGKVDKLYRFLYLSHFAYGKLRGKSYNPNAEGVKARTIDRIETYRDRLRGATIRSGDYADVVKEFDGKDTFFFLDPPYPGHDVAVGEDRFDEGRFRKILDGIKGKFLVTYGTRGRLDTSGFHVKKIRTPRTIRTMRGVGGPKTLPQLLIANYAFTEKSLGSYVLDDVEMAVDLTPDVADELDVARVLAKALADETGATQISELAGELDRLERPGEERTAALADAFLKMGARLKSALDNCPGLAEKLREALPAIADLTTARVEAAAAITAAPRSGLNVKKVRLLKTDEERYVLGIVLEPESVDAQKDIYSPAEVREAAHRFMQDYQNVGLMHREVVNGKVKILESYLAPTGFELDGVSVKKGTWLLAVRVLDDELWQQTKSGALDGFSIGGTAVRNPD